MLRKLAIIIVLAFVALCVGYFALLLFVPKYKVPLQGQSNTNWENNATGWPESPVGQASEQLDERFASQVHPFLEPYCFACHGTKKPKGDFDLTRYSSVSAVAADAKQWELVLERLEAREMPPADAEKKPTAEERATIVAWIRD